MYPMPTLPEPEARAQLLSRILDIFHSNDWNDLDDFSIRLTTELMARQATTIGSIEQSLNAISTTFYRNNHVSTNEVATALFDTLGDNLPAYVYTTSDRITVSEIFPEIDETSDIEAEKRLRDFQGSERLLQDNLRKILRRKKATLAKRSGDSVKEVGDIEEFLINIKDKKTSFTVVVKGYKSTGKSKLTWEDIAHQVTKARRANPDHILIVSAKEPVDELITSIEEYNIDIGRLGCVIFIPPLDMARIMISNGF